MKSTAPDPLPIDQTPVGELLGEELGVRGWSQSDFASILGRPTQFVSEIVTGKKEITRESATQIGAALSQTPEFWLQLQDQYLLAEQAKDVSAQAKLSEVRRRSRLNSMGPIQLLLKRRLLTGSTVDELEAEVMELFELDTMDDQPRFAAAAKRANRGQDISLIQRAWVACVRREARKMPPTPNYSPERLRELAKVLPREMRTPEDFLKLPELLAGVGVRLVYVEALPGAKIDGCAMFVDGVPVVGLSGRGKRLDKVLFALLHEMSHIHLGHVDADQWIVENLEDKHSQESQQEDAANAEARDWIFPDGCPNIPPRISNAWVDETAVELGVARIVLIGQLQNQNRLDWRTNLAKNAPSVGDILPRWA